MYQTFQTYQQLIPLTRHRYQFNPTSTQLETLQAGYYPFRMDCTSFKISSDRYGYVTVGYVATEIQRLPSARLHVIQEALHGIITNYAPSGGHEHESPIAEILLIETEEINAWLRENGIQKQLRPLITFDRGYWKNKRFRELDKGGLGWSIPWRKQTMVGAQLEIFDFPTVEKEPLEILVWAPAADRLGRRIIGKLKPTSDQVWDVLTNDWILRAATILQLQKERWEIEQLFQWLKQYTTIKRPLGKSWMHFVTHCLLITLLQIILVYYLLLLGFSRWHHHLVWLLKDLRYSDMVPWLNYYLIGEKVFFNRLVRKMWQKK